MNQIKVYGTWRDVADAARTTIGKDAGKGEPSSKWKTRMLLAEHSPIRKINIKYKWESIPYWVVNHFTRHKVGIEHFVSTQRTDRTNIDRTKLPQDSLVSYEIHANAQAIINISRKRLCTQASRETRQYWMMFLKDLERVEPELAKICVPDCVYRGSCYEYSCCGYDKSDIFKHDVEYRNSCVDKC